MKNKLEELKPFKVAKHVLTHQKAKSTISTLVKIKWMNGLILKENSLRIEKMGKAFYGLWIQKSSKASFGMI